MRGPRWTRRPHSRNGLVGIRPGRILHTGLHRISGGIGSVLAHHPISAIAPRRERGVDGQRRISLPIVRSWTRGDAAVESRESHGPEHRGGRARELRRDRKGARYGASHGRVLLALLRE